MLLTHNGITQPMKAWAAELGLDPSALRARLRRGWPLERALSEPHGIGQRPTMIEFNGVSRTIEEWAQRTGFTKCALAYRLKQGLPLEEVLAPGDRRHLGHGGRPPRAA